MAGLADTRSWGFAHIPRVASELRALPETQNTPVWELLENVASAPPVVAEYSRALRTVPVAVRASDFGYVTRNRYIWMRSTQHSASELPTSSLPEGASLTPSRTGAGQPILELSWTGKTPMPPVPTWLRGTACPLTLRTFSRNEPLA